MLLRALDFLRCPRCLSRLRLSSKLTSTQTGGLPPETLPNQDPAAWAEDIELGLLACTQDHRYPIVAGVPRMETSSLARFTAAFDGHLTQLTAEDRTAIEGAHAGQDKDFGSTRTSFSLEWSLWAPGDKTWIWDLEERKRIFARDIDLETLDRSQHQVVLDAGCGNGQLSSGIGSLGFEVFAVDMSSSVERAHAIKHQVAGAAAHRVHYIQANLAEPPFEPQSFDVVYSAGVLHHTPNTEKTFLKVLALTKSGGRGYVWLYSTKQKKLKAAVSTALRQATMRMPPDVLRLMCEAAATPVNAVTSILTKVGVRETAPRSSREMAVSLFDEFSPRYQHHHTEEEVEQWFKALGFSDFATSSVDRNGFGMRAAKVA